MSNPVIVNAARTAPEPRERRALALRLVGQAQVHDRAQAEGVHQARDIALGEVLRRS